MSFFDVGFADKALVRVQCRNADFLAGVTGIRKIIFNLISKAQSVEAADSGIFSKRRDFYFALTTK